MILKKNLYKFFLIIGVIISIIIFNSQDNPDNKDRISPPIVNNPIYACATVISVSGYIPGATIEIFADGIQIGGGVSDSPWGQLFSVNPPLEADQKITATQTFDGIKSDPSDPVVVLDYEKTHPEGLPKPSLKTPLHDCGGAIGVSNLVEGGMLNVFADDSLVGGINGCGAGQWIFVNPTFVKDQKVYAQEILCDLKSPKSDIATVIEAPTTLPQLVVGDVYEGGKYVTVNNITNGAMVKVFNGSVQIAGHYCSGGGQIFRLDPMPSEGDHLMAVQSLCLITSEPSDPSIVKKCDDMPPPQIAIACTGDDFVSLSGVVLGTRVRIYANGTLIGDGGGSRINLFYPLQGGEVLTATQSYDNCISPASNPVVVSEGLVKQGNKLIIKNGLEFFKAESGESDINALVFTRGTGCPPCFMIKPDQEDNAWVEIIDPLGRNAKKVTLTQSDSFWSGTWDWSSEFWDVIPDEIPVGEYKASLYIDNSKIEDMPFYVIFSPSEVSAPSEFCISDKGETGIWFYAVYEHDSCNGMTGGMTQATTYALHPDDSRIFKQAISLINGQTDQYESAIRIMEWVTPQNSTYCSNGNYPSSVTKRFVYSVCTSENDVLDLLARDDKLAQCADCACIFTAMLRAMGIPSHPTTADANYEHGNIGWGFDTWAEARIDGPDGEQWYVFHPHYPPDGYGPYNQLYFGTNMGWATKSTNDVIILAEPSWNSSEVSDSSIDLKFKYETSCKEPNPSFTLVKSWIQHLCVSNYYGMGYWGTGHWTCSPAKKEAIMIKLDKNNYKVGDEVNITININNITDNVIKENLDISVYDDNPLTKNLVDGEMEKFTEIINLKPGDKITIKKKIKLPRNLMVTNNLLVSAKIDKFKDFFAYRSFNVKPDFSYSIKLPAKVNAGKSFPLEIKIRNKSKEELKDFKIEVKFPRGLEKYSLPKIPKTIASRGMYTYRVNLKSMSPSYVSQFIITVSTSNAGSVTIFKGINIAKRTDLKME